MKIKSKTGLRVFTVTDIVKWKPCYPPQKYLPEDWRGTAVDILGMDNIRVSDRFWCVLRPELMSEKMLRLFAVWCARQVQHLMTDKRSLDALDVAERFAYGKATEQERAAAEAAAVAAVWDEVGAAARDAARAAAWAARPAAGDAAGAAAGDAIGAAAGDAASAASVAAEANTRYATWNAAEDAQRDKLVEMFLAEGLERKRGERRRKK